MVTVISASSASAPASTLLDTLTASPPGAAMSILYQIAKVMVSTPVSPWGHPTDDVRAELADPVEIAWIQLHRGERQRQFPGVVSDPWHQFAPQERGEPGRFLAVH